MATRLAALRRYLQGWMGYFGLAAPWKLFDKLDQWIRRRLRAGFCKCWRHVHTGVGLTKAWLAAQGLPSLKTLWEQLAPLRRTA